jgi:fumarate hydratase, class II
MKRWQLLLPELKHISRERWPSAPGAAGPEPNEKRIKEHFDDSPMLVTALNPHIGYEKAAKISLTAYREDLSLREAALKLGFVTQQQFDSWVHPEEMTHPLRGKP